MCEYVRVWACVGAQKNVIVRGKEKREISRKNGEKIGEKKCETRCKKKEEEEERV